MNLLKILNNVDPWQKYHDSYISMDRTILFLSYLLIDSDETGYDEYFDQLDKETGTYDKVESLVIDTDYIHRIPKNVQKFKNLKFFNIMGSRFWHLNLKQVPESVHILILTDHTNLPDNCLDGMERLVNLAEIKLDIKPFYFSNIFEDGVENEILVTPQIPDLPELTKISFHTGRSYQRENLKQGWKRILKNKYMFALVKHRIVCINLNENDVFPIIELTLKSH